MAYLLQLLLPKLVISVRIRFVERRASAMMGYVVSEGRLFSLKASEWLVLLGSAIVCGFITLFF